MSGITGGRYSGTFENMRDSIRGENTDPNKIIRGDNNGQVGLHEGLHSIWPSGFERRKQERAQGSENVFQALAAKLGSEAAAQQIFTHIGVERTGEFRIGDFQKIEDRISELERSRLDSFSQDWQRHVEVPTSMIGEHTRTYTTSEEDFDGPKDYYGYPMQFKDVVREERYVGVEDGMNRKIESRIRQRLNTESNGGQIKLQLSQIKQFIGEEVAKFSK